MKYILGGVTIEAIDTYVRVTTRANTDRPKIAVTDRQCPEPTEVAALLFRLQGYWPDNAQLQACSRAAQDAHNNKVVLDL